MLQTNYIFRAIVAVLMTMFAIVAGSVAKGEVTGQLFPGTFSNSPPVDAIKTTTHAQSPKVLTRQLADQANLKEIDAALGSDGKTRVIVKIKASNEMKRLADNSDLTPTKIVEAFLSSAEVLYQINSNGMSVSAQYDFIPFLTVEIDANGLQMLTMHPDVVSIEPDRANRMFLSESVPLVVGVSNPWTTKYDGNKSWVAVLDSGIDVSHPMFAGKQILEACYTTNASCPNGQNRQIGAGAARPVHRHGTHVAGIAVGNYISSQRLGGVAHNANLIAIRVFDRDMKAYDSAVLAALNYVYTLAATRRVAAANLSFGKEFPTDLYYDEHCNYANKAITAALKALRMRRVAPVAAAEGDIWYLGYDDPPIEAVSFPACISHAVAVTNAYKNYSFGTYSTSHARSYFVSIAAPGMNIRSAIPGGRYGILSGTSMAAPHVSGLFAILREHRPNATVAAMQSALDNSGRNIGYDTFRVMWPKAIKALDNIGGHPDRVVLGFNVRQALNRMQDFGAGSWSIKTGSNYGGFGTAYSWGRADNWEDFWGVGSPHSLMLPRTHFNGSIAAKIRRVGGGGKGANCLDVRNSTARRYLYPGFDRGYRLCYENSGSAYVVLGEYPPIKQVCREQSFAAVRPNNWNNLLATTGGKYVKFYINGSLLCQHESNTVIYGRPGVSFYNVLDQSLYLVDWFYTKVSGTNDRYRELE